MIFGARRWLFRPIFNLPLSLLTRLAMHPLAQHNCPVSISNDAARELRDRYGLGDC
jgi:hypothetical protein